MGTTGNQCPGQDHSCRTRRVRNAHAPWVFNKCAYNAFREEGHKNSGGVMKKALVFVSAFAFLIGGHAIGGSAQDGLPTWAYPVNPPGLKPPPDDGSLKHVPNSN